MKMSDNVRAIVYDYKKKSICITTHLPDKKFPHTESATGLFIS